MSIFSAISQDLSELEKVKARQTILAKDLSSPFYSPLLFDPNIIGKKNCENLIGQVSLPVGIAGPVSATLKTALGTTKLTDLLIPLATTEGALVASINRGCKLLNECKNVHINIKNVGMTRAPVFSCQNTQAATDLARWIKQNLPQLGDIGESTSHHLTYLDSQIFQDNDLVFTRFAFDTGEAMGMNMVTIATSKIADYVTQHNSGVTCLALSSNLCTDKKTSMLTQKLGRGRWATITCNINEQLLKSILKTNSQNLLATYQAKIVIGSRLAGLSGRNMHMANAAAAILTATGQDIAHTVDISQGSLILKKTSGGIQAKLTLPTIPVGTVGGGTYLPSQSTARSLISREPVTSNILASAIAVASLAGELSGLSSLATGSLSSSHERLGRL